MQKDFSISAQPLATALLTFARQANISVIIQEKFIKDLMAEEVKGKMTAVHVLEHLLAESNLTYKFINQNTVSISLMKELEKEQEFIDEVIVTAQGRMEDLRTVPVAITALDRQALQYSQVENLTDVANRTPSLSISGAGELNTVISLRGISSNDPGVGVDTSVPVYIDDVYQGRMSNVNNGLFDLERIEVLRGPQGVLYGRNALGGAIRFVTAKPSQEKTNGKFRLSVGRFNYRQASGFANSPISKNMSAKFFFINRGSDGSGENFIVNTNQQEDDLSAYRAQILYQKNNMEWLLSVDSSKLDIDGSTVVPINDDTAPITEFYLDACGYDTIRCNASSVDSFGVQKNQGLSARLEQSFDGAVFTSITAYRSNDVKGAIDFSGVPQVIFNANGVTSHKQWSQEFRWATTINRNMNYILGAYIFNEESASLVNFVTSAIDVIEQNNETKSYSLFGQVDWDIDRQWSFEFGLRSTWEEKELFNNADVGSALFLDRNFIDTVKGKWSEVSPKLVLSYQIDNDVFAYGTFAKGFKSGGFAFAATSRENLQPLAPEIATNYELGLKSIFLNNTLRFNTAIFNTEYENIQFAHFSSSQPVSLGTPAFFQTANAGDAEVTGLEFELSLQATNELTLIANYSYLDSEYKDFQFINQTGVAENVSGQSLLAAPENKLVLGIKKDWFSKQGDKVTLRADYRFLGSQYRTFSSDQQSQLKQAAYELMDFNLVFVDKADAYELSFWMKNALNKDYISQTYSILEGDTALYGEPRTFGLTIALKFQ